MLRSRTIIGSAAVLLLTLSAAHAGIVCRDDFQVVNGREIYTPYCGDNNLAAVARQYGVKVSDAEVRNNPGTKDDVCRLIGNDNRVKSTCTTTDGRDRGR